MAINIEAMKAKLEASKNGASAMQSNSKKSTMWKPEAGDQFVRVLPTADGDPFREFHFHYGLGKNPGIYCSKKNDNGDCPICDFASKLWRDGVANDDTTLKNEAKKLFARKRYYSPVLVRGQEADGVRIWSYGKTSYESLLSYILDPDYGDITDPKTGTDIKLTYSVPGTPGSFPKTTLQPRRKPSVLCDDAVANCNELLESVPVIDNLFERKTKVEVQALLDEYLSSDRTVESFSSETTKYNSTTSNLDDEFNKFMNEE